MRDSKKKLDVLICEILGQMQERKYGRKISQHYQYSFDLLTSISDDMGEDNLSEKLIKTFLDSPVNCSEKWTGKEHTHRKRCVRLLSSLAQTGAIDWGKQKPKDISRILKTGTFRRELELFSDRLKENGLRPNTMIGYRRIVTYFLIFCQDHGYGNLSDLKPDDVSRFIELLYRDGKYRPTTIGIALSGLRMFLSGNEYTEPFSLEIPVHLPRSRNIIEVYSEKELAAICRLLLETGLRGTDVCSLTLKDIDWEKDVLSITQDKTKKQLTLPLKATYGNAIYDYLLTERPKDGSEYVFLRSLAPYRQLKAGAIYSILINMEVLSGVQKNGRVTGSRMTRHNAASGAGVPMSDISAVLGHSDPNNVSVYLSTDAKRLAACTLRLPSVEGVEDLRYRELYVRWIQMAAFLPMMRSHGTDTPREPWNFGEPGTVYYDTIVRYIRKRYRMLPYSYSLGNKVLREAISGSIICILETRSSWRRRHFQFLRKLHSFAVTMYSRQKKGHIAVDLPFHQKTALYMKEGRSRLVMAVLMKY